MQKLLPTLFRQRAARELGKSFACDFVRFDRRFAREPSEHFQLRDAVEQRRDQRLNRHQRAVTRARVAPRFEVVRRRQMPVAARRRLVLVVGHANHVLRAALQITPLELRRSVVSGIAAENHERADLAFFERRRQLRERRIFGRRAFAHLHRRAETASRRVDRVRDQMHRQGLSITREHRDLAAIFRVGQILRAFGNPSLVRLAARGQTPERRDQIALHRRLGFLDDLERDLRRDLNHRARGRAHPVIRRRARERHQRFHGVEPVHWIAGLLHFATLCKATSHANGIGLDPQKITVQRENHRRLIQAVIHRHRSPRDHRRRFIVNAEIHRLVHGPIGLRQLLLQLPLQPRPRRRIAALGQNPQARAIRLGQAFSLGGHLIERRFPRDRVALFAEMLRAIGIVETEDRRLGVGVCRAVAVRMLAVTLDFRGPAFVRFHHERNAAAP